MAEVSENTIEPKAEGAARKQQAKQSSIGGNPPIGPDPRADPDTVPLYRRLRDTRNDARRDERQQEAAEDMRAALSLSPSWRDVSDLAQKILAEAAKDVEVLAWLTEAETRTAGHAGLARSFALVRETVTEFGTDLHPRPQEPGDDPFTALAGLNGIGREGTLIQPLRLVPLVPGNGWGGNSLWAANENPAAVGAAMAAAGPAAMAQVFADVHAAQRELDALDQLLSERLGGNAPPLGQIREVLAETERTIRRLGNLAAPTPTESPAPSGGNAALPASGAITTREQAFSELLRISAYFRQAEPHSPIGFALETLVRRGRMDFVALLQELVPDETAREAFLTNAGIRQAGGTQTPE